MYIIFPLESPKLTPARHKWVNDIADAGGSLYCFHIEAAS